MLLAGVSISLPLVDGPPLLAVDAGAVDASTVDAGTLDAGAVDTGADDAGADDAGADDAGAVDTGADDAGAVDSGAVDAGWVNIPAGTRRVTFPQGQTGPGTTGAAFLIDISASRRYRIRYEVMPEASNFDFRAGGKLPGFAGGSGPAGGSSATDGWSGRLMWGNGGRLSFYFYRAIGGIGGIDTGGYGTHWMWAADATLIPGQWNTIEVLVDMNTGETVGYLNGVEKGRQTLTYLWSTTDKIMFSAFFGGQGVAYEPSKNEAMSFRNMVVNPG